MSYTNPTEPQYVPTSGAVNRMQQSLVKTAITQIDAKKEREEEAIADKKLDMQNSINYGKMLGENINGTPIEGILDLTYKGSNKEYAALKRIMDDGKCVSENCEVEQQQLEYLEDGPKASLDFLSDIQANIDTALGGNVDKTHPLFAKLEAAGRVIGKQNLYGTDQGYGIKVNRIKDDKGNYTGQQEIIFTGEEFGEDGWKINNAVLKADPTLISETPDFNKQSANTTKASGILEGAQNPQNAKVYGKNPGLDLSFALKMDDGNPPQPLDPGLPESYQTEPYEQTFTDEKTGIKTTFTSQVYVFDKDQIKARLEPEISADIDTMFDKKAGGPNDAIALFNDTFTNKNSGSYAVTEENIKDYKWLTKDGKIDYYAGDPSKNDFGSEGSIYDTEGKLKPKVKELYQKIYTDHYIRENVDPKIKNIRVPDSEKLTGIITPAQQIAEENKRKLLEEKDKPKIATP